MPKHSVLETPTRKTRIASVIVIVISLILAQCRFPVKKQRQDRMRRPEIVLFGDSLTGRSFDTGGWGSSIAHSFSRKADVVLRGYGGYNSRWAMFLLNHIFPRDLNIKPPVAATIFFGANDAALPGRISERQHVPVEEYVENLRKMVLHLKECSSTILVILITPPPVDEQGRKEFAISQYGDKAMELPERTNEATGVYAKRCVELAEQLGVYSIDIWSKMQQTQGWEKKFLSDGLHLTPEGNAVVYSEVMKVFDKTGLTELPYDFPAHSDIDEKNPKKAFQQYL